MVKMMKVIRKGSDEKATLATDCKLKERLERGAVQASSSHMSVSGIERCRQSQSSDS